MPLLPDRLPYTTAQLPERFRQYFLKVPIRSLWYSKLDFFHQPLAKPPWALLDRQYLNCTFKNQGFACPSTPGPTSCPCAWCARKPP